MFTKVNNFLYTRIVNILQSEVGKALKEMRTRKATGDDDIHGDVLKLLGDRRLKILTKLSNTLYSIGEWPQTRSETPGKI